MRPNKISILAAALSVVFVGGCSKTDKTADTAYGNEPATTASQPATQTPPPADTTAGTNTSGTDATGIAGATGIEPTTPTPPATTTADATTSFDDMDTNNDGSISQEELSDTSPLRKNFSTADKDGNGTLSRAEVDAQRNAMPPPGG